MSTIDRVRQLYQELPEAGKSFSEAKYTGDLHWYLGELKKDPPTDFSMQTLDIYVRKPRSCHHYLALVLAHLPAEIIYRELGDDALVWTCVNYPYSEQGRNIFNEMQSVTGRNAERFEKAKLAAWDLLRNHEAGLVRNIYDFIEAVPYATTFIDLPFLLQADAKPGVKLSDERLTDYSLEPLATSGRPTGYVTHNRTYIWLDSPVGLTLTYRHGPNAVVGFFPTDPETMIINQLQGVRPIKLGIDGVPLSSSPYSITPSRGLMPLDWQKLLVEASERIAHQLGYSRLGIQSGHNNQWVRLERLTMEKALQRYDAVAERLGFEQAANRNWYRTIQQGQS